MDLKNRLEVRADSQIWSSVQLFKESPILNHHFRRGKRSNLTDPEIKNHKAETNLLVVPLPPVH